ncbi:MAG: DUF2007 domain-containing protein [Desulfuromonadales bacterium]|nr:DUF2007 domain-containing protein [Desulfuromonadales bacterium]
MSDELITIASFDSSFAAESAKALLESSQIQAFLLNSHASSIRPSLALHGGVRLQVLSSQAEDAVAILRAHYQPAEGNQEVIRCPACQSQDFSPQKSNWLIWALIILSFGLLLATPGRFGLICKACGFRWKPGS